ncbi:hypothetical protein FOZ61_007074 [Perkinsus olseni]|uniref:Endonuclease/exonuclease/phosphatase domain-containing protein n=1 Tax=Perkinsus olseni TaxID=32597 RepID=A0A7J6LK61_PEROL|nr:hypothetical protein FOZ61_007074 [Perkinsus olseni]KAF4659655.1 hypothetical protein FOL46_006525 [Perkinsus olseni]
MPSSNSTTTTSTSEDELLAPYDVTEPVVINEDGDNIEIRIHFNGRLVALHRRSSDDVDQVLKRMRLSMEKSSSKKKKHQKASCPMQIHLEFMDGQGHALASSDEPTGDGAAEPLSLGSIVADTKAVSVNEEVFPVAHNIPTIEALSLKLYTFARYPVFPQVECSNVSPDDLVYEYYDDDGELVHVGKIFFPSDDLIGKKLKVVAYHSQWPETSRRESPYSRIVLPSPSIGTFRDRRLPQALEPTGPTHLRVASFNVLGQRHIRTPLEPIFYHVRDCKEVVDFDYRAPLLMRELLDVKADVAALQEADTRFMDAAASAMADYTFWLAEDKGRESEGNKGRRGEGCGLAFRKDRFEEVGRSMLELGSDGLLEEFTAEEIATLQRRWAGVDIFKDVFDNLGMVAQLLTLRDRSTSQLYIVGNTHLYHSPKAPHVKILQTHMIMKALERLMADHPQAIPVFCGDLNSSSPAEAVVDYFTTGEIPADHRDWRNGPYFTWSNRECEGIDRSTTKGPLGIHLHHGVKCLEHVPEEGYTNAVCGWKGIIDHIFYDRYHLRPLWSLPILSDADVESCNGALPYKCYGSDHVMITTEFETL